jgi:hypothetical protein
LLLLEPSFSLLACSPLSTIALAKGRLLRTKVSASVFTLETPKPFLVVYSNPPLFLGISKIPSISRLKSFLVLCLICSQIVVSGFHDSLKSW